MSKVTITALIDDEDTFDEDASELQLKDLLAAKGVSRVDIDWGPGAVEIEGTLDVLLDNEDYESLLHSLMEMGFTEVDSKGL